jgi:hypothetical protein
MKHHYGDFLYREGDYWHMLPNRERFAYNIEEVPTGDQQILVTTINKDDAHWNKIFTFPNLEEVTLHEPSKEQIEKIAQLKQLKRLRITHARPKDIQFLTSLINLEELVLEYVSGFSDLSPLRALTKLKSLHCENLRKADDFSALAGMQNLRFLRIDGTLDWKQPIANFAFLEGLPNLEILQFGQVITKTPFPAFLPALKLKKLQYIGVSHTMFDAKEYALLSAGLSGVKGCNWKPYYTLAYSHVPLPKEDVRNHLPEDLIRKNHPDVLISYTGERLLNNPNDTWLEFIGKGAGRIKIGAADWENKRDAYAQNFEQLKQEAKKYYD